MLNILAKNSRAIKAGSAFNQFKMRQLTMMMQYPQPNLMIATLGHPNFGSQAQGLMTPASYRCFSDSVNPTTPPKRRGRPPKNPQSAQTESEISDATPVIKRPRGRPKKILTEEEAAAKAAKESAEPKKRGRPKKLLTEEEMAAKNAKEAAGPKKRGRPKIIKDSDEALVASTESDDQPKKVSKVKKVAKVTEEAIQSITDDS